MPQTDPQQQRHDLKRYQVLFGLAIFAIYYVADVVLDVFLFAEGTFLQQLLHPDQHEISIRLLAGFFFALTLGYCRYLLQRTKQAEAVLRETNQHLIHANRDLTMFSHALAHDLKNPLSGLSAASEILSMSDELDPEDAKVSINAIQLSVERMDLTINALLKLSDIELQPICSKPVDLSTIIQTSLERCQREHPQRQINFQVTPRLLVSGDPGMLSLAMDNLVTNAIKFTRDSNPADISFRQLQHDSGLTFCLEDNGCGFPAEAAKRIFLPFSREHSDARLPGTGIGLATVQRIIERHNGRVWAEGTPDTGARIFFTLPDDLSGKQS